MMRWLPALLGVMAWTVAAAAQAPYAPDPVTLLVVADSAGSVRPPELYAFTRAPDGRFYLGISGRPLASVRADGGAGAYLQDGHGQPVIGGELAWLGDTLAVHRFPAWQLFSAADAPLECRPFEEMGNEFITQVFARQPLAGGLTLGELTPPYPDERVPQALVVSRGQTVLRGLHERPSGPHRVDVPFPWGGGALSVAPPFAASTLWAASDDGARVVVVESDQPAAPGPHPVRLLWMNLEGRVLSESRITLPARPVTADDRRQVLANWVHHMTGGTLPRDTAAAWRAFEEAIRFPAFHPAATDLRVARDGTPWLRVGEENGRPVWLRPNLGGGEPLRIAVDPTFNLVHVDGDALWGRLRAADGSLRVVAYPLPGRPPLFGPGFGGFALPAETPAFPTRLTLDC